MTDKLGIRSVDLDEFRAAQRPSISPDLPLELFVRKPLVRRPSRPLGPTPQRRVLHREPDLPAVGALVDKYRLERAIGIGGFGVVYRARHVVLDTVVALKLMRPSVARQRPMLPRLLREEARFTARIEHPNVVRVLDVTTHDQLTYIVMEFVDGPDLSVMIRRRGALPPRMVLRIVRHIASALAAGLEQQLIHRDVKPSNILLTRDGVSRLTDFGLALSSADSSGARGVVGTIGYMSPEQLDRPASVDFRSDIYSLGVTAYQALAGSLPFLDDDPARCASAHRTDPVPPLPVAVPGAIQELIVWMLAKHRDRRPSSYRELDDVLRDLSAATRGA
jgi:serine/threonine protein kinase